MNLTCKNFSRLGNFSFKDLLKPEDSPHQNQREIRGLCSSTATPSQWVHFSDSSLSLCEEQVTFTCVIGETFRLTMGFFPQALYRSFLAKLLKCSKNCGTLTTDFSIHVSDLPPPLPGRKLMNTGKYF